MKMIPLTQNQHALIDDSDFDLISRYKWYYHYNRRTGIQSVRTRIGNDHVEMHRLLLGQVEGLEPDHINRNRLDNRRHNLRFVTRHVNALNRSMHNPTGFRGVRKLGNRFKAQITYNRKSQYLGTFDLAIDAARAFDEAAIRLYGASATLNFPAR